MVEIVGELIVELLPLVPKLALGANGAEPYDPPPPATIVYRPFRFVIVP
jgi:hypothetical protein